MPGMRKQNFLFGVAMPTEESRDLFLAHLKKLGFKDEPKEKSEPQPIKLGRILEI